MRYADTTKVSSYQFVSLFLFTVNDSESISQAEWESAEERRERLKQEEEMMNAMEEDDDY